MVVSQRTAEKGGDSCSESKLCRDNYRQIVSVMVVDAAESGMFRTKFGTRSASLCDPRSGTLPPLVTIGYFWQAGPNMPHRQLCSLNHEGEEAVGSSG